MLLPSTSWDKNYIFSFFIVFIGIFLFTNLSKAEKMLFAEGQQEVKNQDQTQSFKEPEWDGVYVIDNSGNYHELIPVLKGKIQKIKSSLTGEYLNVTTNPQEVNYVSWNNFKGFLFKGQQVAEKIQINKAKRQRWLWGDEYNIVDLQANLYELQMRCKTGLAYSYCEFNNKEVIKKYLGDGGKSFCLSIRVGELPEKGRKMYIVCFEE
jgi:hypothetical protein